MSQLDGQELIVDLGKNNQLSADEVEQLELIQKETEANHRKQRYFDQCCTSIEDYFRRCKKNNRKIDLKNLRQLAHDNLDKGYDELEKDKDLDNKTILDQARFMDKTNSWLIKIAPKLFGIFTISMVGGVAAGYGIGLVLGVDAVATVAVAGGVIGMIVGLLMAAAVASK